MRSATFRRLSLMGSLLAALVAISGMATAAELKPGMLAPDFTLMDAEGNEVTLSELKDKLVVLEWTNPDCPFVKVHYDMKTMTKLQSKFAEKEVVWLAVNSTHYNEAKHTLEWTKQRELGFATLLDPSGEVGHLYGAKTTPHMFIIDGDRKVLYNGAIDDVNPLRGDKEQTPFNYVDAALTAALKGEAIEHAATKPYGCSVKYAEKKVVPKTES